MPSRRRVLATCAAGFAGAFAGCTDPSAVLSMDQVTGATDVAREATVPSNPDAPPDHSDLLDEALAAGAAEVGDRRPPFDPERPVRHRGSVYEVDWTVVDEQTRTEYEIEQRYDPAQDREPDVAYDDLPAVDRDALGESRYFVQERTPDDREPPDEERRFGVRRYYDEAEREASVLVPESEHDVVAFDGVAVEIEVDAVEVTVEIYRYEATEVAASVSGYGAELRDAAEFALEGLDDEERAVVAEAIAENAYYATDSNETAFDRVADRLLSRDPIHVENSTGEWLVRYDGGSYWTELDTLRRDDLHERLEDA